MNLIWITPEFPSSQNNTKGIYIYRTVKELSKYYNLYVICLYPAAPPIMEMIKHWGSWREIYKEWKSNYPKNANLTEDFADGKIIYHRYFRLPRTKFSHTEGWFAYIQARKYLKNIVTKDTVIHANWIMPSGAMAKIISEKYKIPYITSLMGSDVHRLEEGSKFSKAAEKILSQADKIISVSQELIDVSNKKKILHDGSEAELIYNIYEDDKFVIKGKRETRQSLNISNNLKIIFYAGGLVSIKNVDVLIKAISYLLKSEKNIHLFIAGMGEKQKQLEELSITENISSSITFLGPLNTKSIIDYYNVADVLCLPSKNEGLPNVIVESFFCGTPVVATKVGGIPTIVKDGENGFLVEPNSVSDLAEKIQKTIHHNWNREKIRKSISHYSNSNVIHKYHKIYNSLNSN